MKIAKYYKMIQEHPHSFELHDERDGRSFHVAKQGLDEFTHARIKKIPAFADGGIISLAPLQSSSPATPAGGDIPYDSLIAQDQATKAEENKPFGTPTPAPMPVEARAPVSSPQSSAPQNMVPSVANAELSQAPQNPIAGFSEKKASGLEDLSKSIKGALGSEEQAHKQTAAAWKDYGSQVAKLEDPIALAKKYNDAGAEHLKAIQSGKIDPDHYWNSKSTGAKISAGLGLILGGLGSGLTGGPNMAAQAIHEAIDRDMEAQKNDQSKHMNLWKMNREAMGDEMSANLQTRNQLLTAVEAKAKMFAQSIGGAETQLKFAPLLMDIEKQKQENSLRMGLAKGGMTDMDPAHLVPILVKNPEQQDKVYKEIQAAQNTKHMSKSILNSFEEAVKENTVMRTGAGLLRTPASVYALHQAMQPTFADLEGTVRQAAMDNTFKNITPAPGDSDHTIQQKREAVQEYLKSKSSAPMAKGAGIDLSRFQSTTTDTPQAPEIRKMNGVEYMKVPGGWKKAG